MPILIVDEAHSTGVLGTAGSGACEALGVKDRVPIRIGTLSKAIGSQGGFVAAPRVVIDFLINRCRSLIYSTALSPVCVAAAEQALRWIESDPQSRIHLQDLARMVRRRTWSRSGCSGRRGADHSLHRWRRYSRRGGFAFTRTIRFLRSRDPSSDGGRGDGPTENLFVGGSRCVDGGVPGSSSAIAEHLALP